MKRKDISKRSNPLKKNIPWKRSIPWKIGAFAAAILCVFFILRWYQLTCVAHLMEDVRVIDDSGLSRDMLQGAEAGKASYVLPQVAAGEPVYRRAGRMYAGGKKISVETAYPFFANEGNALVIMGGEPKLVDTEFAEVSTFTGMYVSNGLAFNYDKTQADEDSYLFLKLNNGLFMNTQTITFSRPGGTDAVRMNSVLYLGQDAIRYSAIEDECMVYGEVPSTRFVTVEIGGLTMSYEQLRERLGLVQGEAELPLVTEQSKGAEGTLPEMEADTLEEENNAGYAQEEDILTEEERRQLAEEARAAEEREKKGSENRNEQDKNRGSRGDKNQVASDSKVPAAPAAPEAPKPPAGGAGAAGPGTGGGQNQGVNAGSGSGSTAQNPGGAGEEPGGSEGSGNGSSGENPGESGENPGGNQGSGSGNPGEPGGNPGNPGGNQGSGSGNPGGNPGDPGKNPGGNQGSGSGNPGENPGNPGENPGGNQGSGSGNPGGNPGEPGKNPGGNQGSGSGNPGGNPGEPGENPGDPGKNPGGNQGSGSGNPGENPGNPGENPGGNQGSGSSGENPGDPGENPGGNTGDQRPGEDDPGEENPGDEPGDDEPAGSPEPGDSPEIRPGEGEGGGTGSGNGGNRPVVMPTGTLEPPTADVYSLDTRLSLQDLSGIIKRVVLELYWQPANEDGSAREYSPNPDDYLLMYRKTYRSEGDVHIDNLPPNTYIYARGIIYYYMEGNRTGELVFYEGFDDCVKTLDLSHVDDIYVDFRESDAEETLLPYQMKIFDLSVSGPNENVLDKIRSIDITAKAVEGKEAGKTYSLTVGINEARSSFFYREDPEQRQDWTSDVRQVNLPSDTTYEYTIRLRDTFGNAFTRVVQGYHANTVDSKENKSLNCCDKREDYFEPAGRTSTAKVRPAAAMKQAGFGDGRKDIDRIAFDIQVNDPDGAAAPYRNEYVIRLYEDTDTDRVSPIPFRIQENGPEMTELTMREAAFGSTPERYAFYGLTAGKTYSLYITGAYNLQDNRPVYRDMTVGTQRFSTISLGNYGRVAYQLSAEHVLARETDRYESATAQQISMRINYNQTIYDLVDLYVSSLTIKMENTASRQQIFQGTVSRELLEAVRVDGEGTGQRKRLELSPEQVFGRDYSSGLEGGYVPRLMLEYTDFAPAVEGTDAYEAQLTAWDLFTSPSDSARFILLWEDGSLESVSPYLLTVQTTGYQGGEYHDVTSRSNLYRRISFNTLKKMPYVTYDDILVVSDYVELFGVRLHDEDRAITGGSVLTTLTGQNPVNSTVDYGALSDGYGDGYIDNVAFNKLRIGNKYDMNLMAAAIRRDTQGRYVYRNESLLQYGFIAGDGINGELVFDSIIHPLVGVTGTRKDYIKYDASDYERSTYLNDNGTTMGNQGGWFTSGYIDVQPGEIYYFGQFRENDTYNGRLAFYDAAGNPVKIGYESWSAAAASDRNAAYVFNIYNDNCVMVPEGAYKLRFSGANSVSGLRCYALADCISLSALDKEAHVEALKSVALTPIKENNTVTSVSFAVKEGLNYAITRGRGTYDVEFFSENGTSLGKASYNNNGYQAGQHFTAPAGAVRAVAKRVSGSTTVGSIAVHQVNTGSSSVLEQVDYARFTNSVRLTVSDAKNNLIAEQNRRIYLDVLVNGEKLTGSDYPLENTEDFYLDVGVNEDGLTVTQNRSILMSFDCVANKTYELRLYVKYFGREIVLDTLKYDTNRATEVIHNEKELAKLMRNRFGDFILVADLNMGDDLYAYESETYPFYGTLDCQGHSITMRAIGGRYFINTIGAGGVVKNFVLNFTVDSSVNKKEIAYARGLSYRNYGTISDFVINLNLGMGMYRKTSGGGACYENLGTIENFALYYAANSTNYIGSYMGGICYANNGNIRNGMAYSQGPVNTTTGVYKGSDAISSVNTGLVVGSNGGEGLLENVYVLGSMSVEEDSRYNTTWKDYDFSSNGLLSGTNGGVIRNSFSVGDMLKTTWNQDDGTKSAELYTRYGPLIGGGVASNNTKLINNYYFTQSEKKYSRDVRGRHQAASSYMMLQDISFYDSTVNSQGMFNMDDVAQGYYPRVLMDESVYDSQRKIALDTGGIDNTIQYQSCRVKEQHEKGDVLEDGTVVQEDYALAEMTFTNRLGRRISDIQVNGLKVTAVDGSGKYEQKADGALYRVQVRLTPDGTVYTGSYEVESFVYDGSLPRPVTEKYVSVDFYKELRQDNWLTAVNSFDAYYKLGGDIDFEKFEPWEKTQAAAVFQTGGKGFTGILDGKGHKLANFELTEGRTNLFDYLSNGQIRDLEVENLKISHSGNSAYLGLVGRALNMSELSGIVLKGAEYTGVYTYGGGLVGYLDSSSITDCVVSGLAISSGEAGTGLRVGGLVGYNQYSNIGNCLVRGLEMDTTRGKTAEGCGGMAGVWVGRNPLSNAYAQGNIDTKFAKCGGLVGSSGGTLTSVWANVGIVSSASLTGGITGQVGTNGNISQALAVGEIFTTAIDGYGRINGGFLGNARTLTRCYSFEGQMINSEKTPDLFDAAGFLNSEQMRSELYYWNTVNLGYSFDYSEVAKGYLPKLYYQGTKDLLPCQEEGLAFALEGIDFTARGEAAFRQEKTAKGNDKGVYDLKAQLRFTVEGLTQENLEQYFGKNYGNITLEDLEKGSEPTVAWEEDEEGKRVCVLTYEGLKPRRYVDSYRVVYSYGGNKMGVKLEFEDTQAKEVRPLYYHIYRVRPERDDPELLEGDYDLGSWFDAMWKAGGEYENFMVMNDLDFEHVSGVQLGLQVKRLEGYLDPAVYGIGGYDLEDASRTEKERYNYLMSDPGDSSGNAPVWPKLKNVSCEVTDADSYRAWFYEISGTMRYIGFENVALTNRQVRAYNECGLIRANTGTVQYVDFDRIAIDFNKTNSYIGCIAQNQGVLEYVRLRDIQVTSPNRGHEQSVSYIGGLCGYSTRMIAYVSASGRMENGDYTYSVEGSETWANANGEKQGRGSRAGGVVGSSDFGVRYVFVDTVHVKGSQNTGGVSGHMYNHNNGKYPSQNQSTPDAELGIFVEVKNSKVEGFHYTGGAYGTGHYSRYNRVTGCEIVSEGDYAGGIVGNEGYCQYHTVEDCRITARRYAGGISGNRSGYYSTVRGCTIYADEFAGGITGRLYSDNNDRSGVYDSVIYAKKYAGGLTGSCYARSDNRSFYDVGVTNTLIGRTASSYPKVEKTESQDGTVKYEVSWASDGKGLGSGNTDYAGGISGFSSGYSTHHFYIDDSVEVRGGSYVGGAYGQCDGGNHNDFAIGARVEAQRYAGGFAGELTGYGTSPEVGYTLYTPKATMRRAILAGSVVAKQGFAGGIAGEYVEGIRRVDPETGEPLDDEETGYIDHMDAANYSQILLAHERIDGHEARWTELLVNHRDKEGFWTDPNKMSEAVANLRIFEAVKLGAGDSAQTTTDRYSGTTAIRPWAWYATEQGKTYTAQDYEGVMTVSYPDMTGGTEGVAPENFYRGTLAQGGLYLNNTTNTGIRDQNFDLTVDAVRDVVSQGFFPYVRRNSRTLGNLPEQDGIRIPGSETGSNLYSMADYSGYFDGIRLYASGAGTVNIDFPAEVAQAGEIFAQERAEILEGLRELMAQEGLAEALAEKVLSGAETGLTEREWSEMEKELAGAGMDQEAAEQLCAYAQWMPEEIFFTVTDSQGRKSEKIPVTQRTCTIGWDFAREAEVAVSICGETKTFALSPQEYVRTVMVWGEHCYYLKADGVYRGGAGAAAAGKGSAEAGSAGAGAGSDAAGNGSAIAGSGNAVAGDMTAAQSESAILGDVTAALKGEFLHLYKGQALGADGVIYDVETGIPVGAVTEETLFEAGRSAEPLYHTEFDGTVIDTFRSYSLTDAENESEYRILAKNGKLFGIDPEIEKEWGICHDGFIVDYYATSQGSAQYLSVLRDTKVVEDLMTPVAWPVDERGEKLLRNSGIRQMADTVNAESPYALIRYYDNTVAAFNYMTGTLLFVDESEKTSISLGEFATLWFKGLSASFKTDNAFRNAESLVESLTRTPIDDSLLRDDGDGLGESLETARKPEGSPAGDGASGGKADEDGKYADGDGRNESGSESAGGQNPGEQEADKQEPGGQRPGGAEQNGEHAGNAQQGVTSPAGEKDTADGGTGDENGSTAAGTDAAGAEAEAGAADGNMSGAEAGTGNGTPGKDAPDAEAGTEAEAAGGNMSGAEAGTAGGNVSGAETGTGSGTPGKDAPEAETEAGAAGGNMPGAEAGIGNGTPGKDAPDAEAGTEAEAGAAGGNVSGAEAGTGSGTPGKDAPEAETGTEAEAGAAGGNMSGAEAGIENGTPGKDTPEAEAGTETKTGSGTAGKDVPGTESGTGATGGEVSGAETGTESGISGGSEGRNGNEAAGSVGTAGTKPGNAGGNAPGAETGAESAAIAGKVTKSESEAESGTPGSAKAESGSESGRSESENEAEEPESADLAEDSAVDSTGPNTPQTARESVSEYSDKAYVTMITAKEGGYEIYKASDLLTVSAEKLMSENDKIRVLELNRAGLAAANLEEMKVAASENRVGLALVAAASGCVLVLLFVLYRKKKKMM